MYDHMCKIRWVNNMVKKEKTFFISNSFDGSSSPDLFLDRTILFYLLASPLSNIRLISSKRVIQVFVRKIIYSQTIVRSNRGIRIFIRSMSFFLWNSGKRKPLKIILSQPLFERIIPLSINFISSNSSKHS